MGRGERVSDPESGMVSAELAVSLVALLLVLAMVLGAVRAGLDRAAATSVAGAVAREGARGGSTQDVWHELRDGLPPASSMVVSRSGRVLTATVTVPVRVGVVGLLLPDKMSVRAVSRLEDP